VRVELHPEARAEFRSAALWYEERRDRLGEEFVAAIAAALQRISEVPESFPTWPGTQQTPPVIHKATVERFPYLIAFEQHEDYALVLGVAHQKRRPLYWLGRASQGPS
jgi:plasmid stabilization system protein ParE